MGSGGNSATQETNSTNRATYPGNCTFLVCPERHGDVAPQETQGGPVAALKVQHRSTEGANRLWLRGFRRHQVRAMPAVTTSVAEGQADAGGTGGTQVLGVPGPRTPHSVRSEILEALGVLGVLGALQYSIHGTHGTHFWLCTYRYGSALWQLRLGRMGSLTRPR